MALNNSGIEGKLGDAFLNHLCYADDIYLIVTMVKHMSELYATIIINHSIMVQNHFLRF